MPKGALVSAPDATLADFGLPRTRRLQLPSEYAAALHGRNRWRDDYFAFAVHPGTQGARLGITVPRRHVRRAVDRNRIKRQIRESFRTHHAQLPHWDVVIMAQATAATAPVSDLRQSLTRHWARLQQRCASSS